MEIFNIIKWLICIDIPDTLFCLLFIINGFYIFNFKSYLEIKNKKVIAKHVFILSAVIGLATRINIILEINVAFNGIISLFVPWVYLIFYFWYKTKKIKINVVKVSLSVISGLVFILIIQFIYMKLVSTLFITKGSIYDYLNNFNVIFLISVPLRIISILVLLGIKKIKQEKYLSKVSTVLSNKQNIYASILITMSELSLIVFPAVNHEFILINKWSVYYIITIALNIVLFFYILIYFSNKSVVKDNLSDSDRLLLISEMMDGINTAVENVDNNDILTKNITDLIIKFVKPTYLTVLELSEDRQKKYDIHLTNAPDKEVIAFNTLKHEKYIDKIFENKKEIFSNNTTNEEIPLIIDRYVKSLLYIPIYIQGKNYGILMLEHEEFNFFSKDHVKILKLISHQLSTTIEHSILRQYIEEAANRDYLTKMYNRNYFDNKFESILNSTKTDTVNVLLMDIDHFKRFNDTYGHLAGDEVLRKVSSLIQGCIRDDDVLARYGGEEFVLILSNTDHEHALAVAERIRLTIQNSELIYKEEKINITISVGMTSLKCGENFVSRDRLTDEADAALYESKNNGRNRVTSRILKI